MRKQWLAGVGVLVVGIAVMGQADQGSQAPAHEGSPRFLSATLPFGEKSCLVRAEYPTTRMWRCGNTDDIEVHTTARGVGEDSAFVIYSGKGANPGEILIYDMGVQSDALKAYKGLTFWMRGDGGAGNLSIGCNWNQNVPTYPKVGRFPLSQRGWKKYFVPWNQFTPDVSQTGFWYLNLKLEVTPQRPAWASLARVALYTNEETEVIQPSFDCDPPGMVPSKGFIHPGVVEAAKLMPRTLAKLKAGQPVTIVAAGDSITAGAQLWYRDHVPIYFQVLESTLARHYGYAQHRAVLKIWQAVDGKSGRTPGGATNDSFSIMGDVQPDEKGQLPFKGLQVIGVGAGGKDTRFGFEHLTEMTVFHPDLVIWFYGGNDMPSDNRKDYAAYSQQAIKAMQSQGIEVLLSRPTFFIDEPYYSSSQRFIEPVMTLADSCRVPWVDQFGAFHARGRRFVGDLLSDMVHPNEYGHQILASTLATALGVPGQMVWDQPMFRAISEGAHIADESP